MNRAPDRPHSRHKHVYPIARINLRRGLASNLKELGVDDLVIQRILRHGDVGTTQKSYIKVRNMKVENAMRQLAEAFEACTDSVQLSEQPKLVN